MYKLGKFKEQEFAERFTHVPNVTTPEFLIPLAFIPMSDEEAKLRAVPIAPPVVVYQGGGGRGAGGRGYGDREGGRAKGKGRGGKGDRADGWGPRSSNDGQHHGEEGGRPRYWESGDVRNSGERASPGGKVIKPQCRPINSTPLCLVSNNCSLALRSALSLLLCCLLVSIRTDSRTAIRLTRKLLVHATRTIN